MKPPPLSLYVHLPWCARKCPYCDFNSHTAGDSMPKKRYLDALLVDLGAEAERAAGRRVETIFLGGGTPSLFMPEEIDSLLSGIHTLFDVASATEITMEANPGTVECGSPAGYRDAGVNRLSIGGQSLDDDSLRRLGRIHSRDDVLRVVDEARAAGFDNINIDLMHGLPGQNVEAAVADLRAVIALEPQHVSWYQLTLEPNTVFHARPPSGMPDDDAVFEIEQQGAAVLAASGYRQYEVSAFARGGRGCRHNVNYWLFGDYLAAGAGAHGKITNARGVFRYRKPANPLQYMSGIESGDSAAAMQQISVDDLVFEFMLNGLRLREGFSEAIFCERTGLGSRELQAAMRPACEKGLVERAGNGSWRPTERGCRFLNDLQASFLPAGH
ncbi:MAG: radical SAM family heme chaperone HemW [Gammaproteobacteria bacterium]|nr:radical SAM family heme chaperone HemW [Gammaproteobacteria bacterium]